MERTSNGSGSAVAAAAAGRKQQQVWNSSSEFSAEFTLSSPQQQQATMLEQLATALLGDSHGSSDNDNSYSATGSAYCSNGSAYCSNGSACCSDGSSIFRAPSDDAPRSTSQAAAPTAPEPVAATPAAATVAAASSTAAASIAALAVPASAAALTSTGAPASVSAAAPTLANSATSAPAPALIATTPSAIAVAAMTPVITNTGAERVSLPAEAVDRPSRDRSSCVTGSTSATSSSLHRSNKNKCSTWSVASRSSDPSCNTNTRDRESNSSTSQTRQTAAGSNSSRKAGTHYNIDSVPPSSASGHRFSAVRSITSDANFTSTSLGDSSGSSSAGSSSPSSKSNSDASSLQAPRVIDSQNRKRMPHVNFHAAQAGAKDVASLAAHEAGAGRQLRLCASCTTADVWKHFLPHFSQLHCQPRQRQWQQVAQQQHSQQQQQCEQQQQELNPGQQAARIVEEIGDAAAELILTLLALKSFAWPLHSSMDYPSSSHRAAGAVDAAVAAAESEASRTGTALRVLTTAPVTSSAAFAGVSAGRRTETTAAAATPATSEAGKLVHVGEAASAAAKGICDGSVVSKQQPCVFIIPHATAEATGGHVLPQEQQQHQMLLESAGALLSSRWQELQRDAALALLLCCCDTSLFDCSSGDASADACMGRRNSRQPFSSLYVGGGGKEGREQETNKSSNVKPPSEAAGCQISEIEEQELLDVLQQPLEFEQQHQERERCQQQLQQEKRPAQQAVQQQEQRVEVLRVQQQVCPCCALRGCGTMLLLLLKEQPEHAEFETQRQEERRMLLQPQQIRIANAAAQVLLQLLSLVLFAVCPIAPDVISDNNSNSSSNCAPSCSRCGVHTKTSNVVDTEVKVDSDSVFTPPMPVDGACVEARSGGDARVDAAAATSAVVVRATPRSSAAEPEPAAAASSGLYLLAAADLLLQLLEITATEDGTAAHFKATDACPKGGPACAAASGWLPATSSAEPVSSAVAGSTAAAATARSRTAARIPVARSPTALASTTSTLGPSAAVGDSNTWPAAARPREATDGVRPGFAANVGRGGRLLVQAVDADGAVAVFCQPWHALQRRLAGLSSGSRLVLLRALILLLPPAVESCSTVSGSVKGFRHYRCHAAAAEQARTILQRLLLLLATEASGCRGLRPQQQQRDALLLLTLLLQQCTQWKGGLGLLLHVLLPAQQLPKKFNCESSVPTQNGARNQAEGPGRFHAAAGALPAGACQIAASDALPSAAETHTAADHVRSASVEAAAAQTATTVVSAASACQAAPSVLDVLIAICMSSWQHPQRSVSQAARALWDALTALLSLPEVQHETEKQQQQQRQQQDQAVAAASAVQRLALAVVQLPGSHRKAVYLALQSLLPAIGAEWLMQHQPHLIQHLLYEVACSWETRAAARKLLQSLLSLLCSPASQLVRGRGLSTATRAASCAAEEHACCAPEAVVPEVTAVAATAALCVRSVASDVHAAIPAVPPAGEAPVTNSAATVTAVPEEGVTEETPTKPYSTPCSSASQRHEDVPFSLSDRQLRGTQQGRSAELTLGQQAGQCTNAQHIEREVSQQHQLQLSTLMHESDVMGKHSQPKRETQQQLVNKGLAPAQQQHMCILQQQQQHLQHSRPDRVHTSEKTQKVAGTQGHAEQQSRRKKKKKQKCSGDGDAAPAVAAAEQSVLPLRMRRIFYPLLIEALAPQHPASLRTSLVRGPAAAFEEPFEQRQLQHSQQKPCKRQPQANTQQQGQPQRKQRQQSGNAETDVWHEQQCSTQSHTVQQQHNQLSSAPGQGSSWLRSGRSAAYPLSAAAGARLAAAVLPLLQELDPFGLAGLLRSLACGEPYHEREQQRYTLQQQGGTPHQQNAPQQGEDLCMIPFSVPWTAAEAELLGVARQAGCSDWTVFRSTTRAAARVGHGIRKNKSSLCGVSNSSDSTCSNKSKLRSATSSLHSSSNEGNGSNVNSVEKRHACTSLRPVSAADSQDRESGSVDRPLPLALLEKGVQGEERTDRAANSGPSTRKTRETCSRPPQQSKTANNIGGDSRTQQEERDVPDEGIPCGPERQQKEEEEEEGGHTGTVCCEALRVWGIEELEDGRRVKCCVFVSKERLQQGLRSMDEAVRVPLLRLLVLHRSPAAVPQAIELQVLLQAARQCSSRNSSAAARAALHDCFLRLLQRMRDAFRKELLGTTPQELQALLSRPDHTHVFQSLKQKDSKRESLQQQQQVRRSCFQQQQYAEKHEPQQEERGTQEQLHQQRVIMEKEEQACLIQQTGQQQNRRGLQLLEEQRVNQGSQQLEQCPADEIVELGQHAQNRRADLSIRRERFEEIKGACSLRQALQFLLLLHRTALLHCLPAAPPERQRFGAALLLLLYDLWGPQAPLELRKGSCCANAAAAASGTTLKSNNGFTSNTSAVPTSFSAIGASAAAAASRDGSASAVSNVVTASFAAEPGCAVAEALGFYSVDVEIQLRGRLNSSWPQQRATALKILQLFPVERAAAGGPVAFPLILPGSCGTDSPAAARGEQHTQPHAPEDGGEERQREGLQALVLQQPHETAVPGLRQQQQQLPQTEKWESACLHPLQQPERSKKQHPQALIPGLQDAVLLLHSLREADYEAGVALLSDLLLLPQVLQSLATAGAAPNKNRSGGRAQGQRQQRQGQQLAGEQLKEHQSRQQQEQCQQPPEEAGHPDGQEKHGKQHIHMQQGETAAMQSTQEERLQQGVAPTQLLEEPQALQGHTRAASVYVADDARAYAAAKVSLAATTVAVAQWSEVAAAGNTNAAGHCCANELAAAVSSAVRGKGHGTVNRGQYAASAAGDERHTSPSGAVERQGAVVAGGGRGEDWKHPTKLLWHMLQLLLTGVRTRLLLLSGVARFECTRHDACVHGLLLALARLLQQLPPLPHLLRELSCVRCGGNVRQPQRAKKQQQQQQAMQQQQKVKHPSDLLQRSQQRQEPQTAEGTENVEPHRLQQETEPQSDDAEQQLQQREHVKEKKQQGEMKHLQQQDAAEKKSQQERNQQRQVKQQQGLHMVIRGAPVGGSAADLLITRVCDNCCCCCSDDEGQRATCRGEGACLRVWTAWRTYVEDLLIVLLQACSSMFEIIAEGTDGVLLNASWKPPQEQQQAWQPLQREQERAQQTEIGQVEEPSQRLQEPLERPQTSLKERCDNVWLTAAAQHHQQITLNSSTSGFQVDCRGHPLLPGRKQQQQHRISPSDAETCHVPLRQQEQAQQPAGTLGLTPVPVSAFENGEDGEEAAETALAVRGWLTIKAVATCLTALLAWVLPVPSAAATPAAAKATTTATAPRGQRTAASEDRREGEMLKPQLLNFVGKRLLQFLLSCRHPGAMDSLFDCLSGISRRLLLRARCCSPTQQLSRVSLREAALPYSWIDSLLQLLLPPGCPSALTGGTPAAALETVSAVSKAIRTRAGLSTPAAGRRGAGASPNEDEEGEEGGQSAFFSPIQRGDTSASPSGLAEEADGTEPEEGLGLGAATLPPPLRKSASLGLAFVAILTGEARAGSSESSTTTERASLAAGGRRAAATATATPVRAGLCRGLNAEGGAAEAGEHRLSLAATALQQRQRQHLLLLKTMGVLLPLAEGRYQHLFASSEEGLAHRVHAVNAIRAILRSSSLALSTGTLSLPFIPLSLPRHHNSSRDGIQGYAERTEDRSKKELSTDSPQCPDNRAATAAAASLSCRVMATASGAAATGAAATGAAATGAAATGAAATGAAATGAAATGAAATGAAAAGEAAAPTPAIAPEVATRAREADSSSERQAPKGAGCFGDRRPRGTARDTDLQGMPVACRQPEAAAEGCLLALHALCAAIRGSTAEHFPLRNASSLLLVAAVRRLAGKDNESLHVPAFPRFRFCAGARSRGGALGLQQQQQQGSADSSLDAAVLQRSPELLRLLLRVLLLPLRRHQRPSAGGTRAASVRLTATTTRRSSVGDRDPRKTRDNGECLGVRASLREAGQAAVTVGKRAEDAVSGAAESTAAPTGPEDTDMGGNEALSFLQMQCDTAQQSTCLECTTEIPLVSSQLPARSVRVVKTTPPSGSNSNNSDSSSASCHIVETTRSITSSNSDSRGSSIASGHNSLVLNGNRSTLNGPYMGTQSDAHDSSNHRGSSVEETSYAARDGVSRRGRDKNTSHDVKDENKLTSWWSREKYTEEVAVDQGEAQTSSGALVAVLLLLSRLDFSSFAAPAVFDASTLSALFRVTPPATAAAATRGAGKATAADLTAGAGTAPRVGAATLKTRLDENVSFELLGGATVGQQQLLLWAIAQQLRSPVFHVRVLAARTLSSWLLQQQQHHVQKERLPNALRILLTLSANAAAAGAPATAKQPVSAAVPAAMQKMPFQGGRKDASGGAALQDVVLADAKLPAAAAVAAPEAVCANVPQCSNLCNGLLLMCVELLQRSTTQEYLRQVQDEEQRHLQQTASVCDTGEFRNENTPHLRPGASSLCSFASSFATHTHVLASAARAPVNRLLALQCLENLLDALLDLDVSPAAAAAASQITAAAATGIVAAAVGEKATSQTTAASQSVPQVLPPFLPVQEAAIPGKTAVVNTARLKATDMAGSLHHSAADVTSSPAQGDRLTENVFSFTTPAAAAAAIVTPVLLSGCFTCLPIDFCSSSAPVTVSVEPPTAAAARTVRKQAEEETRPAASARAGFGSATQQQHVLVSARERGEQHSGLLQPKQLANDRQAFWGQVDGDASMTAVRASAATVAETAGATGERVAASAAETETRFKVAAAVPLAKTKREVQGESRPAAVPQCSGATETRATPVVIIGQGVPVPEREDSLPADSLLSSRKRKLILDVRQCLLLSPALQSAALCGLYFAAMPTTPVTSEGVAAAAGFLLRSVICGIHPQAVEDGLRFCRKRIKRHVAAAAKGTTAGVVPLTATAEAAITSRAATAAATRGAAPVASTSTMAADVSDCSPNAVATGGETSEVSWRLMRSAVTAVFFWQAHARKVSLRQTKVPPSAFYPQNRHPLVEAAHADAVLTTATTASAEWPLTQAAVSGRASNGALFPAAIITSSTAAEFRSNVKATPASPAAAALAKQQFGASSAAAVHPVPGTCPCHDANGRLSGQTQGRHAVANKTQVYGFAASLQAEALRFLALLDEHHVLNRRAVSDSLAPVDAARFRLTASCDGARASGERPVAVAVKKALGGDAAAGAEATSVRSAAFESETISAAPRPDRLAVNAVCAKAAARGDTGEAGSSEALVLQRQLEAREGDDDFARTTEETEAEDIQREAYRLIREYPASTEMLVAFLYYGAAQQLRLWTVRDAQETQRQRGVYRIPLLGVQQHLRKQQQQPVAQRPRHAKSTQRLDSCCCSETQCSSCCHDQRSSTSNSVCPSEDSSSTSGGESALLQEWVCCLLRCSEAKAEVKLRRAAVRALRLVGLPLSPLWLLSPAGRAVRVAASATGEEEELLDAPGGATTGNDEGRISHICSSPVTCCTGKADVADSGIVELNVWRALMTLLQDEEPLIREEAVSCCSYGMQRLLSSTLFRQWRRYSYALERGQETEQQQQQQRDHEANPQHHQADLHCGDGHAQSKPRNQQQSQQPSDLSEFSERQQIEGEWKEQQVSTACDQMQNREQASLLHRPDHLEPVQLFSTIPGATESDNTTATVALKRDAASGSATEIETSPGADGKSANQVSSSLTGAPAAGSEATASITPSAKQVLLQMQRLEQVLVLATCTDTPTRGCEASLLLQLLLEVMVQFKVLSLARKLSVPRVRPFQDAADTKPALATLATVCLRGRELSSQVFPAEQTSQLLWELVIAAAGEEKNRSIRSFCLHKFQVLLPSRGSGTTDLVRGTVASTAVAASSSRAVTNTTNKGRDATGPSACNGAGSPATSVSYRAETARCGGANLQSTQNFASYLAAPGESSKDAAVGRDFPLEEATEQQAADGRTTATGGERLGTKRGREEPDAEEQSQERVVAPEAEAVGERRKETAEEMAKRPVTATAKRCTKLTAEVTTGERPLFDEEPANLHAEEVLLGQTAARHLLLSLSDASTYLWNKAILAAVGVENPSVAAAAGAVAQGAIAESARRDGGLTKLLLAAEAQSKQRAPCRQQHSSPHCDAEQHQKLQRDRAEGHQCRHQKQCVEEQHQNQQHPSQQLQTPLWNVRHNEHLRFLWNLGAAMQSLAGELEDARLCLEVLTLQRIIWGQSSGTFCTQSAPATLLLPQLEPPQQQRNREEEGRNEEEMPFTCTTSQRSLPCILTPTDEDDATPTTRKAAPEGQSVSVNCTQQWLFQPFVVLLLKTGISLLLVPPIVFADPRTVKHCNPHCSNTSEAKRECGSFRVQETSSKYTSHKEQRGITRRRWLPEEEETSRKCSCCNSEYAGKSGKAHYCPAGALHGYGARHIGSGSAKIDAAGRAHCRHTQCSAITCQPHAVACRHQCVHRGWCCVQMRRLRNTVKNVCQKVVQLHTAFQEQVAKRCVPHWVILHITSKLEGYSTLLLRALSTREQHEQRDQDERFQNNRETHQEQRRPGQEQQQRDEPQKQHSRLFLPGDKVEVNAEALTAEYSSNSAARKAFENTEYGERIIVDNTPLCSPVDTLVEAFRVGSALAAALLYALPRGGNSFCEDARSSGEFFRTEPAAISSGLW